MRDVGLPPGWREAKLGELGSFSRGRGGTKADEDPNGMPCIRYGDLYTHHDCIVRSFASSISPASASSYTRLQHGDVVFAGSGETFAEIGKAAAYCGDAPAYAGADTIIFRPGPELLPHFAGYAVNCESANAHKSRMGQGSSVIHIGSDHLAQMLFKLPPREQQQRIAEILSTVAEAIEQTEALIAKTQQIKAGLMRDLFTRGVTADGQLRPPREEAPRLYKESSLGWIPNEWDVAPCGEVFEVQLGKMMSPAASAGPNQKLYLRNQNVYWDRLDLSDVATMHFSSDDMHKYRLKDGDLLACEGRFIGRCAVWRGELDECYYQKALHRLRAVGSRVTTDYMQFFMSLRFELDRGFVEKMTHESTIPHLPLEKLVALPVLIPARDEQDYLVRALSALTHRAQIDRTYLDKAKQLKAALMKDLLTGRVTVDQGVVLRNAGVAVNV